MLWRKFHSWPKETQHWTTTVHHRFFAFSNNTQINNCHLSIYISNITYEVDSAVGVLDAISQSQSCHNFDIPFTGRPSRNGKNWQRAWPSPIYQGFLKRDNWNYYAEFSSRVIFSKILPRLHQMLKHVKSEMLESISIDNWRSGRIFEKITRDENSA